MEEKYRQVFLSASKALSLLSKARCVESYAPTEYGQHKILYSWPTKFDDSEESVSCLTEKGVAIEKFYRVKSYGVPYNDYKRMRGIVIPEISRIRSSRRLIDVARLVLAGDRVINVTAVWDTDRYPDRAHPKSMSDIQGLDDFSSHDGSMLVFHLEGEKYDIKFPAHAYGEVLRAKPKIGSYSISPRDRSEFIGKDVDRQGRSKRYVVHSGNRMYLQEVLRQTSSSVETFFGKVVGQYS
jgi:hypothetical protein